MSIQRVGFFTKKLLPAGIFENLVFKDSGIAE
jgi:hypothetical protein